jgi:HEPN domain-containing protein
MPGIVRWERGRAEIDALVAAGRLERVAANHEHARHTIEQALLDLSSARVLIDTNPVGAFSLTYDAARKALTAVLANQGLRPKGSEGGHAVLLDVVLAQLDPPLGNDLREFDWMRHLRNDSAYPSPERSVASRADVADAPPAAARMIEIAAKVIDQMPVY